VLNRLNLIWLWATFVKNNIILVIFYKKLRKNNQDIKKPLNFDQSLGHRNKYIFGTRVGHPCARFKDQIKKCPELPRLMVPFWMIFESCRIKMHIKLGWRNYIKKY
jgi:hypothetical protein